MGWLTKACFRWLMVAALELGCILRPAKAWGGEVRSVVIGEGMAWIREFRRLALQEGKQDIQLEGIPAEADLRTLQLYALRARVRILEWGREREQVWCRVQSALSAPKVGVDVVYGLTGLTWGTTYEIVIRSEPASAGRVPVSSDLIGSVHIRNDTSTDFTNVIVRLVASEASEAERKSVGLLVMDRRTPLSDLWFPSPPERGPPHAYDLSGKVDLLAGRTVYIPLVNQLRIAAERRYVLRSPSFPLDAKEFRPLRENIVIPYKVPLGVEQRMALPPGRARVFLGPRRDRFMEAQIHRAAQGEEIRVDTGPSAEVMGRRAKLGDSPLVAGERTETREIRVLNHSLGEVLVEIEEQPDIAGQWNVLSCTVPYVERMGRLLMRLVVPAGGENAVVYRVRARELSL